jgi:hypothetical protein
METNGRPAGWKVVYEAKAPDPRAGWARPLVHGHALGAADTRCATALRRGGPRACTDAIGTPQASLEERKAHTGFEPVPPAETLYEPLRRKLEQFTARTASEEKR